MRWETKGVAKFNFNLSNHGNIVGDAKCVLCKWKHHITSDQNFGDVIEHHIQTVHPGVMNSEGVQSTSEGAHTVDYFVVSNPLAIQAA